MFLWVTTEASTHDCLKIMLRPRRPACSCGLWSPENNWSCRGLIHCSLLVVAPTAGYEIFKRLHKSRETKVWERDREKQTDKQIYSRYTGKRKENMKFLTSSELENAFDHLVWFRFRRQRKWEFQSISHATDEKVRRLEVKEDDFLIVVDRVGKWESTAVQQGRWQAVTWWSNRAGTAARGISALCRNLRDRVM